MPNFSSTTEEKIRVRIAPFTAAQQPSEVEQGSAKLSILTGGATAVQATQEEIDADVAAGGKGLVGYLVSEATAGVSTWKVEADADLTGEVKTISDGGTYTYNSPLAAQLGTSGDTLPK